MEKISVIIPAYNAGRFLPQAIDSIHKQTHKPHEIIVVDDGSDDNTETVVKNITGNIHYHFQENTGVASARNQGLELATGDLITFIDADDIWVKNKIEIQLNLLKNTPQVDIVIGFLRRVAMNEYNSTNKIYEDQKSGVFALQLGSALIRKGVFQKVGNFDEKMKMSEDLDWFLRVKESKIDVFIHDDVVQYYRQHENNITRDHITTKHSMLKAFKKSLDRRRKAGIKKPDFLPTFDNLEKIKNYWESKSNT